MRKLALVGGLICHRAERDWWYPELIFLIVVFSNSTNLAIVIPNSIVKRKLIIHKPHENLTRCIFSPTLFRDCTILHGFKMKNLKNSVLED